MIWDNDVLYEVFIMKAWRAIFSIYGKFQKATGSNPGLNFKFTLQLRQDVSKKLSWLVCNVEKQRGIAFVLKK